jgi:GGDEF domain-containing protein
MRGISTLTTFLGVITAASAWALAGLYGTPLHWAVAVLATAAVGSLLVMNRELREPTFDHSQIKAALGREIFRARRYQRPFAALIIDLSHAPQEVSAQLAIDVRTLIRKTDEVGFWSERELLLILSESKTGDASALAERIKKELIPIGVGALRFGVTEYQQDDSIQTMVERLSAALRPVGETASAQ